MAMSVGGDGAAEKPMSDINTTPLVDVMLVLLIIFLIAIPVVVQSVPIELPKVVFEPTETKPENILLAVTGGDDGKCHVFWGMKPVTNVTLREMAQKKFDAALNAAGGKFTDPEQVPEVHIRGDVNTPYRCIGGTIFNMQMVGFIKVGFISEPPPNSQL